MQLSWPICGWQHNGCVWLCVVVCGCVNDLTGYLTLTQLFQPYFLTSPLVAGTTGGTQLQPINPLTCILSFFPLFTLSLHLLIIFHLVNLFFPHFSPCILLSSLDPLSHPTNHYSFLSLSPPLPSLWLDNELQVIVFFNITFPPQLLIEKLVYILDMVNF